MDPRYNWPPQASHGAQGFPNGQYGAASQHAPAHGYQQHRYGSHFPPSSSSSSPHMAHGYAQSQPAPGHPRVVIPPRANHAHPTSTSTSSSSSSPSLQPPSRSASGQPQVVIPPRSLNAIPQMANPRIRQVQVPVQRPAQRTGGGGALTERDGTRPQPRPAAQTPSKPQRPPSSQENTQRSQQRPLNTPTHNQSQHRVPLQAQRTPSSQPSPSSAPPSASRHPQIVVKKPSSKLTTPSSSHHAPVRPLPADLMVLVLSAADEYIAAARSLGSTAAMTLKPADLDQYYRLMSAALGCIETVLKKYSMAPRDEAMLRLRYVGLLVEETDNNQEIEDNLAKGISLCNRNRLTDLKYAMQHLQARYQFKSNHRAALKLLDQPISETETFQHIAWLYAFRFLKVSLALQVPGRPETTSALQQLQAIVGHAERRQDSAVFVTACVLEAMIHLRSSGMDRLEHAQRAIASARSLQLQLSEKQLGPIATLIDLVDVACSLQQGLPNMEKLTALHHKAEQLSGRSDGVFSVLIEKSSGGNTTIASGGVFRKADDGRDELVFSWLPGQDFATLVYYLSGMLHQPSEKGNTYLQEGHRLTQTVLRRSSSMRVPLPASIAQRNWVKILDWHVKFALGLVACYHEDNSAAREAVSMLQERVSDQPFGGLEPYARMLSYLTGVVDQVGGSVDSALARYSAPEFELPDAGSESNFKTDLAILAAINRLLIIGNPSHPDHAFTQVLCAQLQPFCINHPNQFIECAFRIIKVITSNDDSINRQKTLIHNTTNRAQRLHNWQFMSICLCYMSSRYFVSQVGDQSIKSIRAARKISKQYGNKLWRAVSLGLCILTFERNGMMTDANECRQALDEIKNNLPPALRGQDGDADADGDVEME